MRLFKRQTIDTDPQLVSATTIQAQDGIVEKSNDKEVDVDSTKIMDMKKNNEDVATGNQNSAISTLGRRFGRKWGQLTRSESSDFLSVSGRKKRWNLKQEHKLCDDSLDIGKSVDSDTTLGSESGTKCKKSSRIESIMNHFRSNDKLGTKNISINDHADDGDHDCYQRIERFHSDSVLKGYRYYPEFDNKTKRVTELKEQKQQIKNLISDLEEKGKTLDFIIENPDLLKTDEGVKLARENLNETLLSKKRILSQSTKDLSKPFNQMNKQKRRSIESSGLEDVMNNLRVWCDESGYDTDSTRTGADSPDEDRSKHRMFSMMSDDYQGVDLSVSNLYEKDNVTNPLDDTVTLDLDSTITFEEEVTPVKLGPLENVGTPKPYTPRFHKSTMNLMDNELSPCKDSPPLKKLSLKLQCVTGKRSRSKMESVHSLEQLQLNRNKIKKTLSNQNIGNTPVIGVPRPIPLDPPKQVLLSRELKTIKLTVPKQGGLGLTLDKCGTARSAFIVAQIQDDGEAGNSKQFKIGDEIRRIQHRRLRGLSLTEVNNELERCVGVVELQIAREPASTEDQRIGNTWGDTIVRSKRLSSVPNKDEIDKKLTGMSKFFVKNKEPEEKSGRNSRKKANSLCVDLLTITLDNTENKKLGFSIVGGSDAKRGAMGIVVKEIMSDGIAAEQGDLKAKDEILAVNGNSLLRKTHSEALNIIKTAKSGVMVLHVARKDRVHQRFARLDV